MFGTWLDPLGVSTATGLGLRHVVFGPTGHYQHSPVPVRGVVTRRAVARGETIAEVPLQSCLEGNTAAQAVLSSYPKLIDATAAVVRNASPSITIPFASRGPVLAAVAMAMMRLSKARPGAITSSKFYPWVSIMPRHAPPIGSLIGRHMAEKAARPPHDVSRRLRLGAAAVPYDPTATASQLKVQTMELMLASGPSTSAVAAQLEQPRVEVVVTSSMVAAFQSGDNIALSSGHQAMHRSHRAADSSAFRHLCQLERELESSLLEPLVPHVLEALVGVAARGTGAIDNMSAVVDDDEKVLLDAGGDGSGGQRVVTGGEVLEALKWAHFCVRSRSVNLNHLNRSVDEGSALPAIVPLLDMLNHSALHANVTFRTVSVPSSGGSKVVLVASRRIDEGAELLVNYSDYWRRLVLYDVAVAASTKRTAQQKIDSDMLEMGAEVKFERTHLHNSATAPDGIAGETVRRSAIQSDETRRIAAMAKDLVPSGPATRIIQAEVADAERSKDREGQLGQRRQAVSSAEWAWMFGFVKDEAEVQKEVADKWERSLFARAAKLTAPRSRAEKGEFVVGVPLGLERLQEQRAALVRDKYKGQQVFPPQRND